MTRPCHYDVVKVNKRRKWENNEEILYSNLPVDTKQ